MPRGHILSAMAGSKQRLLLGAEENAMEEGELSDLDRVRRSIDRVSAARKAAKNWRSRSRSSRGEEESPRNLDDSSSHSSSWRQKLGAALDSTPTHVVIVVLLLLDLLATAVDLLLTIHNTSADLRECSASIRACQCDAGGFDSGRSSWEFLHWISVAILCVLLLNVLGLLLAFGRSFFAHAGYVLDLFVVTSALVLEVFFDADTAGLLIILNLWRIVRVAHGIFEVTDEAWENELEEMEERIAAAEAKYQRDCAAKDRRIEQLEARVSATKNEGGDARRQELEDATRNQGDDR